ncbi:DNA methyltransferase [Devosia insulae DS-56]|uniref:site-specific DNA-methyltransferase (adenine-specific) n=1 Tax=Devosia insulae DS-56 TaxID=1116389 RepID=A0A1E5XTS8_9HYPH|nr:DNA methyltransferase [Devosia insulae DS-56]
MTPHEFIAKWANSPIKERAGAQAHFLDLCRLLGEPEPADVDHTGLDYGFEVGATKTTGGNGFADVFKRGFFAWEYKGTRANLDDAFAQLQRYAVALDNPPLLIVSDIGTTIRIYTNWTNSVSKRYEIAILDLEDPVKRGWLKSALSAPEALRPAKTRQELTEEVASEFAVLAHSLRRRGHKPEEVAHFINRLVFCMFAEDVKLLPDGMFTRMLGHALDNPAEFETFARELFGAMTKGGRVGFERVKWFNGGLFDGDLVFPLTRDEIKIVHKAAGAYWGDVDPSILGTLFERGLDPDKRSQLGAHYTDREKIMMIIDPVIVEPLAAEWDEAKAEIAALMGKAAAIKGGAGTRAENQAQAALDRYLLRLANYRVLDPACGSGNFLYLALKALKDLEHRAQVEAEALGLPRRFPQIGPEVVHGIELNHYAAELARVSVWIGEIQWMLRNGFSATEDPVLKPLDNIECRDALTSWEPAGDVYQGHWVEAEWPAADAIIGNPPFLGGKLLRSQMGDAAVERLFTIYAGRVPAEADLVVYWLEKGLQALVVGKSHRVGFVTTNSVRAGANRRVMDKIADGPGIVAAWSDEPWTVEGAAVRVSLVVYGKPVGGQALQLDGHAATQINADLTSSAVDLTRAKRLAENGGVAWQGPVKIGSFEVDGQTARRWLKMPLNPNGRANADVLRPWMNGSDIVRRPRDLWIVDFHERTEGDAAPYEGPFEHVRLTVKPTRDTNRRDRRRSHWWLHGETVPSLKSLLDKVPRYIATPRVSRYRVFVWLPSSVLPDSRLVAITRDDDTSFGLLHSRHHELWSLRLGGWHGVGNDPQYTPSFGFETFPFPQGLTPAVLASDYSTDPRAVAVAEAAKRLNELRENWLNPADLVRREPEVVPGYPDRLIPSNEAAAEVLRTRTLTNLYNQRPAWLDHAHKALDAAVAAAYGWPADLTDDEVLTRLFALNQARAKA